MSMTKSEARKYIEDFTQRLIGKDEDQVRDMYNMETAAWHNCQDDFDAEVYGIASQIASETLTVMDRLARIEHYQDEIEESTSIIQKLSLKYHSAGYLGQ